MKITFLGHSGFYIEGSKEKILIDPFLTDNPVAVHNPKELENEYILVSHGHRDHLGDSIEIAKHFSSKIIANYEIANYCADKGCKSHGMNIGGSHDFGNIWIKVTMALHGSSIGICPAQYMGNPCGFIIRIDGTTIYHAGDTGIFGDMELISKYNNIDIAMLPIGDNFTMGPEEALEAVKLLKPKTVIPIHYNTWELIAQNPEDFKNAVEKETNSVVEILKPGDTMNY